MRTEPTPCQQAFHSAKFAAQEQEKPLLILILLRGGPHSLRICAHLGDLTIMVVGVSSRHGCSKALAQWNRRVNALNLICYFAGE